ncbi:hypothetical protein [Nonomuraea endophytica]|uniref:Uncharacterized protein n=1 Tax=Nonomuraea endophytica TaxID=714136 RepID=A0A7W8A2F4_9ACTN|nr:hypothetical protein [Nonomuraea endophytica]MBB5078209.1 hypothetical protein [Nonomuraea endophytica]
MITITWILLALAALNAALGVHSVIIDRAPSWAFWLNKRRHSRLGGWASLLMAAFVALLVIVQNAELSHEVTISLLAVKFMALMGAIALWLVEAGRQRA